MDIRSQHPESGGVTGLQRIVCERACVLRVLWSWQAGTKKCAEPGPPSYPEQAKLPNIEGLEAILLGTLITRTAHITLDTGPHFGSRQSCQQPEPA